MPSHSSVTDAVHQKLKNFSCTVERPRSGNVCMFGEKLVVLVGDDLPLFPLSEENRKSFFFLFSLYSELSNREQKGILGVILYIGNN